MKLIYRYSAIAALMAGSFALGNVTKQFDIMPDITDDITPYDDADSKTAVPCPDAKDALVVVAFGQSNSSNHLQPRMADTTNQVYNFYQGKCYIASDPMLGASGRGGSIWVPMGQKLAAATHKKIVISSFGIGGSTIQRWEYPKDLGGHMARNLAAVRDVYPHIDYFLWIQGESDVDDNAPAYGATLLRLIEVTKKWFPDSQFGISSTSFCADRMNTDITDKQKEIATTTPGVFWLGDTDQFRSAGYRRDNCHFDAKGTEAVVDEFMKHMMPLLKPGS